MGVDGYEVLINSMKWSGQTDEKVPDDELKCFPFWKSFFSLPNLMICCVLAHTNYCLEEIFEACRSEWKRHFSLPAFERLPIAENLSWRNSFCFLWSSGYNWNWVYLARRGCKWNSDQTIPVLSRVCSLPSRYLLNVRRPGRGRSPSAVTTD